MTDAGLPAPSAPPALQVPAPQPLLVQPAQQPVPPAQPLQHLLQLNWSHMKP